MLLLRALKRLLLLKDLNYQNYFIMTRKLSVRFYFQLKTTLRQAAGNALASAGSNV
jgi:hypothetical protein